MIERDIKQEEQTYPKEAQVEERIFEIGLRPQSLQEFIGQDDLKENLTSNKVSSGEHHAKDSTQCTASNGFVHIKL